MSSPTSGEGPDVFTIVARPALPENNAPTLSELSPNDKPWAKHRYESDQIQGHYEGVYERYAERISECSQLLDFRLVPDKREQSYRLKLSSTRLCHVRTCQVCSWRRSLMYKARAYKCLPAFIEDHPTTRYLFLTLTMKNCEVVDLRKTLSHLNKSFSRLTRLKLWPGIGHLKTVEITRGRDGTSAHPHLHVLIALNSAYYGRGYIKKKRWIDMWQQSLRVDYRPILDVQAINVKDSPLGLLAELIKYQTKPNDLIFADKSWFLEYTKQIHGTKAFALGGEFREYFREMTAEETDEEMINGSDGEAEVDEGHLLFGWKKRERKYRMIGHE